MVTPKWVFFDCCNTLLRIDDTSEYWTWMAPIPVEAGLCPSKEAFNQAYRAWRRQRRQALSMGNHTDRLLPDGLRQILMDMRPAASPVVIAKTVGRMVDAYSTNYLSRAHPAPGVREMLDAWRGVAKMGVVSNFFLRDFPRRLLTEFGLDAYFEFVLDSACVGYRKPARAIYIEALRKARLEESQVGDVLFVGDNLEKDVLTPARMGMRAIHYSPDRRGPSSREENRSQIPIRHWDEFRSDLIAAQQGGVE